MKDRWVAQGAEPEGSTHKAPRAWLAWVGLLAAVAVFIAGAEGSAAEGGDVGVIAATLGRGFDAIVPFEISMPDRRWVALVFVSSAALLFLTATVGFAARPQVLPRLAAGVGTAISAWALVAVVPASLSPELRSVGSWLRLALALAAGAFTIKLALLLHMASAFPFSAREGKALLSNQRKVLDALGLPVPSSTGAPRPFELKQVTGPWGAGKSQVLDGLRTICGPAPLLWSGRNRATTACVRIDIWKHDSELDLHRAIVTEILGHPACVLPWGWLRYPLVGTVRSYLHTAEVSLPIGQASVAVPVALPRLSWQKPLERTVARLNRRGIHLAIVLDELDRASSVVAQAALSMVHRSLDLPGVTVVLVHVPEVVEQKVFSPLFTEIADLRSNATVMVLDRVARRAAAGDGEAKALWSDVAKAVVEAGPAATERSEAAVLDHAAKVAFSRWDQKTRDDIVDALSEKFLRANPIRLSPPVADDVVTMLGWPNVAGSLRTAGLLVDGRLAVSSKALADVVGEWQLQPLAPTGAGRLVTAAPLPPIRQLKNRLEAVIGDLVADVGDLAPADLLVAMLITLETCRPDSGDDGA